MEILVVGRFCTEGFALHIAETLSGMGHSVRRFEPDDGSKGLAAAFGHRAAQASRLVHAASDALPVVRARRIRRLWDVLDGNSVDLCLVTHDFLWPREVAELKRLSGAPVVLWFPDALVNFGRGFFMVAPYDALFFKDPYIVHAMADVLQSPVHYLPESFNPARHDAPEMDPGAAEIPRCDVTTAGNLHSWRTAVFRHLAGHDVRIWGFPAPRWMPRTEVSAMAVGRPIENQAKAREFRQACIVVNNLHYGEIWGVNARCFEAAGAGAFQLVDWRPGLEGLFEDGSELVTFRTMADLRSLVGHWLPREEERRAIAEAGRRRAHREHTYEHRLDLLLGTVAGKERGFPLPRVAG